MNVEQSCAPTQVGSHKNGTAQVPGQRIYLFINKNHWSDNNFYQLILLPKQTVFPFHPKHPPPPPHTHTHKILSKNKQTSNLIINITQIVYLIAM